jgi:aspartate oxidase
VLVGWRALDLLATPAGVGGVLVADAHGRQERLRARETVLATGGIGRLFRYTTNGPYATGDGLAMALAAGARTAALEFVQFHPTALRVDADPLPLLTEALRGAGWPGGTRSAISRRAMSSRAPCSSTRRPASRCCSTRAPYSPRPAPETSPAPAPPH